MKSYTCNRYVPLYHVGVQNKVISLLIFKLNDSKSHLAVIEIFLSSLDPPFHDKPENTRSMYSVQDVTWKKIQKSLLRFLGARISLLLLLLCGVAAGGGGSLWVCCRKHDRDLPH